MRWMVSSFGGLLRAQGVLVGLLLLLIVLALAQALGPADWDAPLMAVPAEVAAAWRHVLASDAGPGEWRTLSTLLTCAFLHGSPEHLLGNLLFYWIFGAMISELLGWRWLLATVVVTALGASAVHAALNRGDVTPMLGASGVVSGFMGAYLALAVRWRLPAPHIWPMAAPVPAERLAVLALVFVALDYKELLAGSPAMIAFGAHVGGFTTGLFLAGLCAPRPASALGRR